MEPDVTNTNVTEKKQLSAAEKQKMMREMRMRMLKKRSGISEEKVEEPTFVMQSPPKQPVVDLSSPQNTPNNAILSPVTPATPIDNSSPTKDNTTRTFDRTKRATPFNSPAVLVENPPIPQNEDTDEMNEDDNDFYQTLHPTIAKKPSPAPITQTIATPSKTSLHWRIALIVLVAIYTALASVWEPCRELHDRFNIPIVSPFYIFITVQLGLLIPSLLTSTPKKVDVPETQDTKEEQQMVTIQKWFDRLLAAIRIFSFFKNWVQNVSLFLFTYIVTISIIQTIQIYI
jgi:hypothetical protein